MIEKGLIPLDKSWVIRMGFLDLMNGYDDTINLLKRSKGLSDDLKYLHRASVDWKGNGKIHVGESGTLFRFLQFASWKLGEHRSFRKEGTLEGRTMTQNVEIVSYGLKDLLNLDGGTSQWASASVLMGNTERAGNLPYKLGLTYEALQHWKSRREKNLMWEPRHDATIERQADSYVDLLTTGKMNYSPIHSEEYCFARAFEKITPEMGEKMFPNIKGHETDRIYEMERSLDLVNKYSIIDSFDHRVVQAVYMKKYSEGESPMVRYKKSVNKSWPQFWKFMKHLDKLLEKAY